MKIAIIGGGASGALVAIQLLHQAVQPLTILLIERQNPFCLGVAYSTQDIHHLLNVPVSDMSVFPNDQLHFLRWAQNQHDLPKKVLASSITADSFLPRLVYGAYLQSTLDQAETNAKPGVQLERITDQVLGIQQTTNEATLHLQSGNSLQAQKVVLALGNPPPTNPNVDTPDFYKSDRYIRSGWSAQALKGLEPNEPILLIGSGLTSIDLIVSLANQGHCSTIHVVSRHGILPPGHRTNTPSPAFEIPSVPTLGHLVRKVREDLHGAETQGLDWRPVLDSLRPVFTKLWQSLTLKEKERFARHVRSYLLTHLRRIPSQAEGVISAMLQSGQLLVHAGRVRAYYEDSSGSIQVIIHPRGTKSEIVLHVRRIINATGPNYNYQTLKDPLVLNLLKQGVISPHPIGGLMTAPNGALLDTFKIPSNLLYTLGPSRVGDLGDLLSIKVIRHQALALALELLRHLP